jgi:hypothetical protein
MVREAHEEAEAGQAPLARYYLRYGNFLKAFLAQLVGFQSDPARIHIGL